MIRFQYKLRSLLIFVTIMALPLGWFSWKHAEIKARQREIDFAERTIGCNIYYPYELDGSSPPGPAWLRRLLGDNAFAEPQIDCLWTNGKLSCLRDCPRLTRLLLRSGSVDDTEELAVLADLPQLTHLELAGLQIGDKELAYMARLKRLQVLDLRRTLVGDAGLQHLVGLKSLRSLKLEDDWREGQPAELPKVPHVTDEGMKYLGKLTSIEELRISCRLVSDQGVRELHGLLRLRSLNLSSTRITDSSLVEIARFPCLQKLNVVYTEITPAGADAYKQSHPKVLIVLDGGFPESANL